MLSSAVLPTESDLLRLIGLVYEAAQETALWPVFMEQYARVLGADVTLIQEHRFKERSSSMLAQFGLTAVAKASYNAHYSRLNPWRNQGESLYTQGSVVMDDALCRRDVVHSSEFYNDYLHPMRLEFSGSGVMERTPNTALVIAALRHRTGLTWTTTEQTVMQTLLPHVTRAWDIHGRLHGLTASMSLLDTMDVGVAFVGGQGNLIYANGAAHAMFTRGDGLVICDDVLRAREPASDARLREALRDAIAFSPSLPGRTTLPIDRGVPLRPYQVTVTPLAQSLPAFKGMPAARAVVLVVDPESRRAVDPAALMQLYELTPREADLASDLSVGRSLAEAARDLGITYETARTHLRRIMEKTSTVRQTELIALLARLPRRAL